jgi:putative two-component system response regulator
VLLKPGRLTLDERRVMQQHTVIGDNLCRTVKSLERVRPIIRSHHERADGRGYPDGLAGDDVPLLARIVGIVDVFDALTTSRPYRAALSTDEAHKIMLADAASGWCPTEMVATFVELHRSGILGKPALPAPEDVVK